MKTILITSAAALLLSVGSASAAGWATSAYGIPLPAASMSRPVAPSVARPDNGTGYYGRGTATGGPVGGLPDRN